MYIDVKSLYLYTRDSYNTVHQLYINYKKEGFPGGAVVKNPLPMQGIWVRSVVQRISHAIE